MKEFKSMKEAEEYCNERSGDFEYDCGGDCCQTYYEYEIRGEIVWAITTGTEGGTPFEYEYEYGIIRSET
tara:strand:+ start:1080 stop:1289 length:210 start_codon:yes stop_codon:yes gene_type:complete